MSEDDQTIFDGPEGGRRPEPTPEWIGPYKVEGQLGAGGMGEVFLAWDERLERRVAIKRIRREAGLSADQRERFRREARLAARLSHPNIVQIYDRVSEGPDDAIVPASSSASRKEATRGGRGWACRLRASWCWRTAGRLGSRAHRGKGRRSRCRCRGEGRRLHHDAGAGGWSRPLGIPIGMELLGVDVGGSESS